MASRIPPAPPRSSLFCLLALLACFAAWGQNAPPMNLDTLKKVLAIGEDVLSTQDVIQRVKAEGVDFFLDADMKTELILAAAEGRRTEADTLKIIDSLADACRPCKERMEAPISADLALKFLQEKVRSKDILKEIKKRGMTNDPVTQEHVVMLRQAGASDAMIRVMKPDAQPIVPDGFAALPVKQAKDFDAKRAYGRFDIRARVDEMVEFHAVADQVLYKAISGSAPTDQSSEISGILPRLPADAWSFTWKQRDGRSKLTTVDLTAPDSFGFQGMKFTINDDRGKDDRYHIEILWQLKPFTMETLQTEVEELAESFPELLISDIRLRGFARGLQPEEDLALRKAGASNEIINVIRGSIRSSNSPTN